MSIGARVLERTEEPTLTENKPITHSFSLLSLLMGLLPEDIIPFLLSFYYPTSLREACMNLKTVISDIRYWLC
jgi:hypothetical protein